MHWPGKMVLFQFIPNTAHLPLEVCMFVSFDWHGMDYRTFYINVYTHMHVFMYNHHNVNVYYIHSCYGVCIYIINCFIVCRPHMIEWWEHSLNTPCNLWMLAHNNPANSKSTKLFQLSSSYSTWSTTSLFKPERIASEAVYTYIYV